jgi:Rrf2 family iron-sulfur cluster assembly transcriptional regulator
MLSKSCEYGLRAALYLSTLDEEGYVSIGTISEELDISFPFLTKIFQKLNDAGLLDSQRGPKGGVALSKPAEEVNPYHIVVAIDGDDLFEECVLGLPNCDDERPCPLHDRWAEERDQVRDLFRDTTLAELAENIHEADLRLVALD